MKFFRRLWCWMRRRTLESDFEEEVGRHLELKTQEIIASGIPAAEAARRAHQEFGNVTLNLTLSNI
jgi:hypothetical protein